MKVATAVLLAGLCTLPALAQSSVKDAIASHWKVSGEFTIAVADKMPADGYTFRPTPEEMSFGQLMAHIANADVNACANASGLTKPEPPAGIAAWLKSQQKSEVSREDAITFLKDTFAFCDKAIAAATWEKLDNIQGPPARKLTGYEWLWSYFTHTAHHRGQAEVYLRVKGIKPPDYKF
ncbi:MAG: DinB family protein [Bryobacteraceae bacterium]|nr:DinB family protein [Bryobacteraceae bacterium]